jgi:hypothetical protein
MNSRQRTRRMAMRQNTTRRHVKAATASLLCIQQIVLLGRALHMGIKRVPSARQRRRQARIHRLEQSVRFLAQAIRGRRKLGAQR